MSKAKAGGFRLGGKALDLEPLPESSRKMKRYLDGLPFDQLVTLDELAKAVGHTRGTVQNMACRHGNGLGDYREIISKAMAGDASPGRLLVFGNRKTIAALRKQLGRKV